MKTKKSFDSVKFFRIIKNKMSKDMNGMDLPQIQEYLQQIKDGKIQVVGK